MSDSATIIRDGDEAYRLGITHRDLMLLAGPGFAEGAAFVQAFGFFENFTVARGIAKGSLVRRSGQVLFDASAALLAAIKRDYDLLCHDYSCKVGAGQKQFGGGQSIRVDGRPGILSLRPKGYCTISFVDGQQPALIDLRLSMGLLSDDGEVKVYRRKADSRWLEILPPLLTYLDLRRAKQLSLEHIDRVK